MTTSDPQDFVAAVKFTGPDHGPGTCEGYRLRVCGVLGSHIQVQDVLVHRQTLKGDDNVRFRAPDHGPGLLVRPTPKGDDNRTNADPDYEGMTLPQVIAATIEAMEYFQYGTLASPENKEILEYLQAAHKTALGDKK